MTEPSSVPRFVFRAAFIGTPRVSPPSASVRGLGLFGTAANSLFPSKWQILRPRNQESEPNTVPQRYEACISLNTHPSFTLYEDIHVGAFNAAALFSLRDEILQISHTAL